MKNLFHIPLLFVVGFWLCSVAPVALSSDEDCNKDINTFLDCNNSRVIKYQTKLTKKDVGNVLKDVPLIDGTVELRGCTFLGEAKGIDKDVHLYIVDSRNNGLPIFG